MFHKKTAIPALCLSLCLCGGMIPTAFAAEAPDNPSFGEIVPYSAYIRRKTCDLRISGGEAKIEALVTGQTGKVDRCLVEVSLQEKSGNTWKTIESWSEDVDSYRASISETMTLTKGKTYRAKAKITVWSGGETESATVTSAEKTA